LDWIGLYPYVDGLDWVGSEKMDPCLNSGIGLSFHPLTEIRCGYIII